MKLNYKVRCYFSSSELVLQVELLVMKALSLGLVKGSIDQVDSKVHMTWVQPRVLGRKQVKNQLKILYG